jgi:N-acetylneuraminate synthase
MHIAGREISSQQSPYLIAEISANHLGKIDEALRLIEAAKYAGADAVKFQCYGPDDITLDCDRADFVVKDGPWKGRRLYELYTVAHTPREWFPLLFSHAKKIGITAFASVFSPGAVDFLETLGCPAYKIASMEIVDIPLIKRAAGTGRPLIISTGMASDEEIYDASFAADIGQTGNHTAFLHCVSGYPTDVAEANLGQLKFLQQYAFQSGISDHSLGWEVPVAATALGAVIIEKHLTMDRFNASEDAGFSLTPIEFKTMVMRVREIWLAMQPSKPESEESSRQLRRSLYAVRDIKAGEKFTPDNVRSIRPSYGLVPKYLPRLLDKTATCDIQYGSALTWEMISHGEEIQDR